MWDDWEIVEVGYLENPYLDRLTGEAEKDQLKQWLSYPLVYIEDF